MFQKIINIVHFFANSQYCTAKTRISGLQQYEAYDTLLKVQTLLNNGTYEERLRNGGYGEWNLGIAAQTITESVGVVVSQNEWTLTITTQDITQSAGVTVTQGSVTGTLKTALTGAGTVSVVVSTAAGTIFVTGVDVDVGSTTINHATITTATNSVSNSGTLKTALTGAGMTNVVIQAVAGVSFVDNANVVIGGREWTLAITAQGITESAGVTVTQGSNTGTLKTALQNQWTLTIGAADITASVGVTVTQGSVTGTLATALTGAGMTSVVINTASGVVFADSADTVIAAAGGDVSIGNAAITGAANNGATTSVVIETANGVTLSAGTDVVIGSTTAAHANIASSTQTKSPTTITAVNVNTATNNGATTALSVSSAPVGQVVDISSNVYLGNSFTADSLLAKQCGALHCTSGCGASYTTCLQAGFAMNFYSALQFESSIQTCGTTHCTSGCGAPYTTCVTATYAPTKILANEVTAATSVVASTVLSGVKEIKTTLTAFAALRYDGSLVTWGNTEGNQGDDTTGHLVGNVASGVLSVYSNHHAFAAIGIDGRLKCWGIQKYGGNCSEVNAAASIVSVTSTTTSFCALDTVGKVYCWGDALTGGNQLQVDTALSGEWTLTMTAQSVTEKVGVTVTQGTNTGILKTALTGNGMITVVIQTAPGTVATFVSNVDVVVGSTTILLASITASEKTREMASPVLALYSNRHAYVAITRHRHIRCWGNANYGGSCDPNGFQQDQTRLLKTTRLEKIVGSGTAFAAISMESKRVYAWGDSANGGDLTIGGTATQNLTNVVKLVSNAYGFAALTKSGNVKTWGNIEMNVATTTAPSLVIPDMLNSGSVTDVIGTDPIDKDGDSFCALVLQTGRDATSNDAYCWGKTSSGGGTTLSNVRSIVGSSKAWAATLMDGTVSTFGNVNYGATVPTSISTDASFHHSISAVYGSFDGFVALYNSSTLLPSIVSDISNSSLSEDSHQCVGCIYPSFGKCKDAYGVCTNHCDAASNGKSTPFTTGLHYCKYGEDSTTQITTEELLQGRDSPLTNGNFEIDVYEGGYGTVNQPPMDWRGGNGGNSGSGDGSTSFGYGILSGPMVASYDATNDGVHPYNPLSARDTEGAGGTQYVLLTNVGDWIETDLLRLPETHERITLSFDIAAIGICGNSTQEEDQHAVQIEILSGKYSSEWRACNRVYGKALVVDISIPSPSFKPVSLSLSRFFSISKHSNKSVFNPINIF